MSEITLITDRTVEEHTLFVCQRAALYTATMFCGSFSRLRQDCPTVVLASGYVSVWERQNPTRRGLIYAVTGTGMSSIVPRRVWTELLTRARDGIRAGMSIDEVAIMKPDLDLIISGTGRKFET